MGGVSTISFFNRIIKIRDEITRQHKKVSKTVKKTVILTSPMKKCY
ncbi:hypothetical protein C2W63_03458 [Bacillus velezensis]|nr:hypothetical protein C2W63_03458 [Bacillus velezensis]RUR96676.1 hypothetical protein EFW57_03574 [Bacillus velezensis]